MQLTTEVTGASFPREAAWVGGGDKTVGRVERTVLTRSTGEQRSKKGPQRMPTVTLGSKVHWILHKHHGYTSVASLCSDTSHISIYVTAFAVWLPD